MGVHWVYKLDPKSGRIEAVVKDLAMPNGIVFSPDERRLLASVLADAGADFGMRAPRDWSDQGFALESDDIRKAVRHYRRAMEVEPNPLAADRLRVLEGGP